MRNDEVIIEAADEEWDEKRVVGDEEDRDEHGDDGKDCKCRCRVTKPGYRDDNGIP